MTKLGLLLIAALVPLGVIAFLIFFALNPTSNSQTQNSAASNSNAESKFSTAKIDLADVKITFGPEPLPQPVTINLYAPKDSSPSGSVQLAPYLGKVSVNFSTRDQDQIAYVYSGTCDQKGTVTYPLGQLQSGKLDTVWVTDYHQIKKTLPLSIRVYKDRKNLNFFTRCGEIAF
jgi:hypothetical protein